MRLTAHYTKIVIRVVNRVSVAMVNYFCREQRSPNDPLRNHAMFFPPATVSTLHDSDLITVSERLDSHRPDSVVPLTMPAVCYVLLPAFTGTIPARIHSIENFEFLRAPRTRNNVATFSLPEVVDLFSVVVRLIALPRTITSRPTTPTRQHRKRLLTIQARERTAFRSEPDKQALF